MNSTTRALTLLGASANKGTMNPARHLSQVMNERTRALVSVHLHLAGLELDA